MTNRLASYVNKINSAPLSFRSFLLTKLFCSQVKFANTAKLKLLEITPNQVIATMRNQKRVQNHIGGVHAVAATLLAESVSGIMLGMHVPDSKIPLIKNINMSYIKRMQGSLTATANITEAQIQQIMTQDKGELLIEVNIQDESGNSPISCEMLWAWVPKKRH